LVSVQVVLPTPAAIDTSFPPPINIGQPALAIQADDDPFVPFDPSSFHPWKKPHMRNGGTGDEPQSPTPDLSRGYNTTPE